MIAAQSMRALPYAHLRSMTDAQGLHEHALLDAPRREHGYCVDDAARALVVMCEDPEPTSEAVRLCALYLRFCLSAVDRDGACHNRKAPDGAWADQASVGDWWGRATWGLGVAAVSAPTSTMRGHALLGFRSLARRRSGDLHAMSFAALGAGAVLAARPDDLPARRLLRDVVACIGPLADDSTWPWPEPRLRYASGAIPAALIEAGARLGDLDAVDRGVALLSFLLEIETHDGHLSVTPVGGRGPGDVRPAFPQQPIEVASLALAARTAWRATHDPAWIDILHLAWRWFLGQNDNGTVMVDPSGGGYDGLEALGRNENRGAESTLAALSTWQMVRAASPVELPSATGGADAVPAR